MPDFAGTPLAAPSGMFLLFVACAPPADDSEPTLDLPEHNECLAHGEAYSDETCLAVVEQDGRFPGVSENKSGAEAPADDPRLADPELQWLTAEIERCACTCCHRARYGGPGAYFWDLDFSPVWIDSASLWSLSVLGGYTEDETQTLPTDEIERVRAYLEVEAERRRGLE